MGIVIRVFALLAAVASGAIGVGSAVAAVVLYGDWRSWQTNTGLLAQGLDGSQTAHAEAIWMCITAVAVIPLLIASWSLYSLARRKNLARATS